jgi:signal peptidase I
MSQEVKSPKSSVIKTVLSVLWWSVVVLLFLVLVNIIGAKMSGKVPSIFGYSVINIVSGSMEDTISEDSYILIKEADPDDIKRGDIICFYSRDPAIYGALNTHRVVEDPITADGKTEFVTKGDANPVNDKVTVRGEDLVGIYVKRLDALTAFSNALAGNTMIIIFAVLQASLIGMAAFSIVIFRKSKKEPEENNSENPIDKK